jgi:hypothetical protein
MAPAVAPADQRNVSAPIYYSATSLGRAFYLVFTADLLQPFEILFILKAPRRGEARIE